MCVCDYCLMNLLHLLLKLSLLLLKLQSIYALSFLQLGDLHIQALASAARARREHAACRMDVTREPPGQHLLWLPEPLHRPGPGGDDV